MLREMDENVENEDEKATKERPPVKSDAKKPHCCMC